MSNSNVTATSNTIHQSSNTLHFGNTVSVGNTAVIWTNGQNAHTSIARRLLTSNKVAVEVRDIKSHNWTKAQLLEAVPGATTVPQVVLNGTVVGNLHALTSMAEFKPKKPAVKKS